MLGSLGSPGPRAPRVPAQNARSPAPPRHPPGRLAHGAQRGRPARGAGDPREGPHVTIAAALPQWTWAGRAGGEFVQPSGSRKTVPAHVGRALRGGFGKARVPMRPRFRERCSWERPTENQGGRGGRGAGGLRGGAPLGQELPPLRKPRPPPPRDVSVQKERQRRREREGLELGRDGKGSQRRKTQRWSVGPNPQHSWHSDHG